jgi:hypothetical protein
MHKDSSAIFSFDGNVLVDLFYIVPMNEWLSLELFSSDCHFLLTDNLSSKMSFDQTIFFFLPGEQFFISEEWYVENVWY